MRRGMTLLEVLVAGIVLAVGVVGSLEAIAQCAAHSREVRERARALIFVRSKMEEILKEPVIQVGTDQGTGDQTIDYDWVADVEPSGNDSLVVITVSATNRSNKATAMLTALRRPDLSTPTDTTGTTDGTGTTNGTTGTTGTTGTGGTL